LFVKREATLKVYILCKWERIIYSVNIRIDYYMAAIGIVQGNYTNPNGNPPPGSRGKYINISTINIMISTPASKELVLLKSSVLYHPLLKGKEASGLNDLPFFTKEIKSVLSKMELA
jgi:hypothetical protein